MKILLVLWNGKYGGIQQMNLHLATELKKNKNLACDVLFVKNNGEFIELFREKGIQFYFGGFSKGAEWKFWKYIPVYKLFRRYTILQLNDFNPIIAGIAFLSRRKIVYVEHGNFIHSRSSKKTDWITEFLKRYFLNYCIDSYISVSNYVKEISENIYGIKPFSSSLIYNGIDNRNLDYIIENKFVVGAIGRLAQVKKLERLIEAFAEIKEKSISLYFIGDGPLKMELEELTKKKGINDRVSFTGYIPDPWVDGPRLSLLVVPSQGEAFGFVAVEALSAGIPVIVFADGGGLTEIVGGIEPDDIVENKEQLIKRLENYFRNPHFIYDRKADRIAYVQKFSAAVMAGKYLEVYNRLSD